MRHARDLDVCGAEGCVGAELFRIVKKEDELEVFSQLDGAGEELQHMGANALMFSVDRVHVYPDARPGEAS